MAGPASAGFGLMTMVLALGWSLFAVLGIQADAAGSTFIGDAMVISASRTCQKVLSLLTRPDLIPRQLQQADMLRYFFMLLLPVGFTALLAPEVLLLALPRSAINLLADFAPMHQVTTLIYAAPVLPFVMVAAVMGWRVQKNLLNASERRSSELTRIKIRLNLQHPSPSKEEELTWRSGK